MGQTWWWNSYMCQCSCMCRNLRVHHCSIICSAIFLRATKHQLYHTDTAKVCANADIRVLNTNLARIGPKHKILRENSNKWTQPHTEEMIEYFWKHSQMMALVNKRWTSYSCFHTWWQLFTRTGINLSPDLSITILSTESTNNPTTDKKCPQRFPHLCIIAAGSSIMYGASCIAKNNIWISTVTIANQYRSNLYIPFPVAVPWTTHTQKKRNARLHYLLVTSEFLFLSSHL